MWQTPHKAETHGNWFLKQQRSGFSTLAAGTSTEPPGLGESACPVTSLGASGLLRPPEAGANPHMEMGCGGCLVPGCLVT